MAWHRLVSSEGLGVGSVAATARGAKRERARSRARHGLSEEVDQRVNEVRGARTRTPIHWSKPDKRQHLGPSAGRGKPFTSTMEDQEHGRQPRFRQFMLLGIASHSLTRRATQGPKQGISHYYDVADKVVIMQRIQGPTDRQDRQTVLLSLSLSLAWWRRSVMQMATTSFSSARCAAHNQRGRPAGMREREKEIL